MCVYETTTTNFLILTQKKNKTCAVYKFFCKNTFCTNITVYTGGGEESVYGNMV